MEQASEKANASESVVGDWSQHMVLGQGAQQTVITSTQCNGGELGPIWCLDYNFSLPGFMPPGPAVFKAQIKLRGFDWVTIEKPVPPGILNKFRNTPNKL
jgi:hypothetical protein